MIGIDVMYKYWRISNVETRGVTPLSISNIALYKGLDTPVEIKNISASTASKVETEGDINVILTKDPSTYFSTDYPKEVSRESWISFELEEPQILTHIGTIPRAGNDEALWVSCNIDVSEDGVFYEHYGKIFPALNSYRDSEVLSSIEVKSFEFEGDPYKEEGWYDQVEGCIFAIDYNSRLTEDGDRISYSNDPSKFLVSYDFQKDKVEKTIETRVKVKNFSMLLDNTLTYKTLRLIKHPFNFDCPVYLHNEFTYILRVKLKSDSLFLSRNTWDGNHGPCYSFTGGHSVYNQNWRVHSFQTGQDHDVGVRSSLNPDTFFDTVVVKGDLRERTVKIITSYGEYSAPPNAYNYFLSTAYNSFLGYTQGSTTWYPDASIVAYGIWNRELTQEELDRVLSKVDEQFLVSKNKIVFNNFDSGLNTVDIYSDIDFISVQSDKIEDYYIGNKPTVVDKRCITSTVHTANILKSRYKNIKDIVLKENEPVRTKLFLYERHSGGLLATTWSNDKGEFEFKELDANWEYIVSSPDREYQFKSIIKDYI